MSVCTECKKLNDCKNKVLVVGQNTDGTPLHDTVCNPLTTCDTATEYESKAPVRGPKGTMYYAEDRKCTKVSKCKGNEYQHSPPDQYNDRDCRPINVCTDDEWAPNEPQKDSQGNYVSQRNCTLKSPCAGLFIKDAGSPTSNRTCERKNCAAGEFKASPSRKGCSQKWDRSAEIWVYDNEHTCEVTDSASADSGHCKTYISQWGGCMPEGYDGSDAFAYKTYLPAGGTYNAPQMRDGKETGPFNCTKCATQHYHTVLPTCQKYNDCKDQLFEVTRQDTNGTGVEDHVCADITRCGKDEYESVPPVRHYKRLETGCNGAYVDHGVMEHGACEKICTEDESCNAFTMVDDHCRTHRSCESDILERLNKNGGGLHQQFYETTNEDLTAAVRAITTLDECKDYAQAEGFEFSEFSEVPSEPKGCFIWDDGAGTVTAYYNISTTTTAKCNSTLDHVHCVKKIPAREYKLGFLETTNSIYSSMSGTLPTRIRNLDTGVLTLNECKTYAVGEGLPFENGKPAMLTNSEIPAGCFKWDNTTVYYNSNLASTAACDFSIRNSNNPAMPLLECVLRGNTNSTHSMVKGAHYISDRECLPLLGTPPRKVLVKDVARDGTAKSDREFANMSACLPTTENTSITIVHAELGVNEETQTYGYDVVSDKITINQKFLQKQMDNNVTTNVANECNGKQSCSFTVDTNWDTTFPDKNKSLVVFYTCGKPAEKRSGSKQEQPCNYTNLRKMRNETKWGLGSKYFKYARESDNVAMTGCLLEKIQSNETTIGINNYGEQYGKAEPTKTAIGKTVTIDCGESSYFPGQYIEKKEGTYSDIADGKKCNGDRVLKENAVTEEDCLRVCDDDNVCAGVSFENGTSCYTYNSCDSPVEDTEATEYAKISSGNCEAKNRQRLITKNDCAKALKTINMSTDTVENISNHHQMKINQDSRPYGCYAMTSGGKIFFNENQSGTDATSSRQLICKREDGTYVHKKRVGLENVCKNMKDCRQRDILNGNKTSTEEWKYKTFTGIDKNGAFSDGTSTTDRDCEIGSALESACVEHRNCNRERTPGYDNHFYPYLTAADRQANLLTCKNTKGCSDGIKLRCAKKTDAENDAEIANLKFVVKRALHDAKIDKDVDQFMTERENNTLPSAEATKMAIFNTIMDKITSLGSYDAGTSGKICRHPEPWNSVATSMYVGTGAKYTPSGATAMTRHDYYKLNFKGLHEGYQRLINRGKRNISGRLCNEDLNATGGYAGCQTKTKTGVTCKPWSEAGINETSNYCRAHNSEDIWCYTSVENGAGKDWDWCDPLRDETYDDVHKYDKFYDPGFRHIPFQSGGFTNEHVYDSFKKDTLGRFIYTLDGKHNLRKESGLQKIIDSTAECHNDMQEMSNTAISTVGSNIGCPAEFPYRGNQRSGSELINDLPSSVTNRGKYCYRHKVCAYDGCVSALDAASDEIKKKCLQPILKNKTEDTGTARSNPPNVTVGENLLTLDWVWGAADTAPYQEDRPYQLDKMIDDLYKEGGLLEQHSITPSRIKYMQKDGNNLKLWTTTVGSNTMYIGKQNVGREGGTCLAWYGGYEDNAAISRGGMGKTHNYCRNPDEDVNGMWCFTDSNYNVQYCDPKTDETTTSTTISVANAAGGDRVWEVISRPGCKQVLQRIARNDVCSKVSTPVSSETTTINGNQCDTGKTCKIHYVMHKNGTVGAFINSKTWVSREDCQQYTENNNGRYFEKQGNTCRAYEKQPEGGGTVTCGSRCYEIPDPAHGVSFMQTDGNRACMVGSLGRLEAYNSFSDKIEGADYSEYTEKECLDLAGDSTNTFSSIHIAPGCVRKYSNRAIYYNQNSTSTAKCGEYGYDCMCKTAPSNYGCSTGGGTNWEYCETPKTPEEQKEELDGVEWCGEYDTATMHIDHIESNLSPTDRRCPPTHPWVKQWGNEDKCYKKPQCAINEICATAVGGEQGEYCDAANIKADCRCKGTGTEGTCETHGRSYYWCRTVDQTNICAPNNDRDHNNWNYCTPRDGCPATHPYRTELDEDSPNYAKCFKKKFCTTIDLSNKNKRQKKCPYEWYERKVGKRCKLDTPYTVDQATGKPTASSYASTDYDGEQTQTQGGLTCQHWNTHTPHGHNFTHVGNHNKCRDVDGAGFIWCYTTSSTRWQRCDPIAITENTTYKSHGALTESECKEKCNDDTECKAFSSKPGTYCTTYRTCSQLENSADANESLFVRNDAVESTTDAKPSNWYPERLDDEYIVTHSKCSDIESPSGGNFEAIDSKETCETVKGLFVNQIEGATSATASVQEVDTNQLPRGCMYINGGQTPVWVFNTNTTSDTVNITGTEISSTIPLPQNCEAGKPCLVPTICQQ